MDGIRRRICIAAAAFLLSGPSVLFAQDAPVSRQIRPVKDNIEAEELALDNRAIPDDRRAVPAGTKFFIRTQDAGPDEKPAIKTKTIFKPEIGLVKVATPVSQKAGEAYPLTLQECTDIAVKNNLQLQISEKNIALAKMRLWEARRNMLPSVTIAYQDYKGRVYSRAYVGRKQYIEGQQPIIDGGELLYTMKQAEANLAIVKNEYEKVRNELILQVKKAYYTLAKSMENRKMQEALATEVERIYGMMVRQLESGVASKLEFLNVSSQASQVKYQLASAGGDESVAELILAQAMNLEGSGRIAIRPDLEFTKTSVDFEKTLRDAFLYRPEMKVNSLMLDYYRYGKNVAKAKGWPKIVLMGNWGLAKEEYVSEDLGDDPDQKLGQQWYTGIKGSMPFWGSTGEYSWTKEQWTPVVSAYQGTQATTSGFKFNILDKLNYYSDKQSAVIDFDRARQELNKIRQDIALEVREGCFNYEKAILQLETANQKVKYQEGDLELVKLKRSMDEAQDSNVVESMIKLSQEKFGYVQALTDCHMAQAAIDKAVGVENYFEGGKLPAAAKNERREKSWISKILE